MGTEGGVPEIPQNVAGKDAIRYLPHQLHLSSLSAADDRPYVMGQLNGHAHLFLCDTGASSSCLSSDLAHMLSIPCYGSAFKAFTASGEPLDIKGVATVTVTLGSKPFRVDALVITKLSTPLILGSDVLKAAQAVITYDSKTMSITDVQGSETIPLVSFSKQQPAYVNFVSTTADVQAIVMENGEKLTFDDLHEDDLDFQSADSMWGSAPPAIASPIVLDHPDLSENDKEGIRQFVYHWQEKFKDSPGLLKNYEAHIPLEGNPQPVRSKPIRLPAFESRYVQKEVDRLLAEGKLELNPMATWCSPCFTVKKPGSEERRLVVSFKHVNECIASLSGGVGLPSEILLSLRGSKWRSRIDLLGSFFQISLDKSSRSLLSFICPSGAVYSPKVLLQGCKVSTAVFSNALRSRLAPLLSEGWLLQYVDDLVIHSSSSLADHLEKVSRTLALLRENDLTVNWSKFRIAERQFRILGHVLEGDQCFPCPSKVATIRHLPVPTTLRKLRSFLGVVSFYRQYVPQASLIMAPLYDLTKKGVRYRWGPDQQDAFSQVKEILCSVPTLTLPDLEGHFSLDVDASLVGCGSVLYAHGSDNSTTGIVEYFSKRFTVSQQRFSAAEREVLALILSLEHFRPIIQSSLHKIRVYTDNSAVYWLFRNDHTKCKLLRYRCRLNAFNLQVFHRPGVLNTAADFLSRDGITSPHENIQIVDTDSVDLFAIHTTSAYDFANSNDSWYNALRYKILRHPKKYPLFAIENDFIIKLVKEGLLKKLSPKRVVSTEFRKQILSDFHDSKYGIHLGSKKTMASILKGGYFWPNMRAEVARYVKTCEVCAKSKSSNQPPQGLMRVREHNQALFSIIFVDIVGPLVRSKHSNKYIVTILDDCSRYFIAKAIRKATAQEVIKVLLNEVVLVHGAFELIVSDNASVFKSKVYQDFVRSINASFTYVPLYSPNRNSVERMHSTLKNSLRALCEAQSDWDSLLGYITFAINNSPHRTLGVSPCQMVMGRSPRGPFDVPTAVSTGCAAPFDGEKYFESLTSEQKEIWRLVKDIVHKNRTVQARTYNLRRRETHYKVGDLVYRRTHYLSDAVAKFTRSLAYKYEGPFKISRLISKTQIELVTLQGVLDGVYPVEQLKPFFDRDSLMP